MKIDEVIKAMQAPKGSPEAPKTGRRILGIQWLYVLKGRTKEIDKVLKEHQYADLSNAGIRAEIVTLIKDRLCL